MTLRSLLVWISSLPWSRIAQFLLLLGLAAVVLLTGDAGWPTTCIIILAALAAGVASFFTSSPDHPSNISLLPFICSVLFVALSFVAFFFSTTPLVGIDEVLRDAAYVLLFFWIARMPSPLDPFDPFGRFFVRMISGILFAACAIASARYAMGLDAFLRIPGAHGDIAWQAFLILSWPFVLHWSLSTHDFALRGTRAHVEMLLRAALIGFLGGCFLLSLQFGSQVVIALQTLVWLALFFPVLRPVRRFAFVFPMTLLIAAIATLTTIGLSTLHQQFPASDGVFRPSVGAQVDDNGVEGFARQSFRLMQEKPLVGWGPGSFRFVRWRVAEHAFPADALSSNVLLSLGGERGVFVAIAFAILVAFLVARTALDMRDGIAFGGSALSLRTCVFIAVVGVLFQNMVVASLGSASVGLPFWLMLGGLAASLRDASPVPRIAQRLFAITLSFFLALTVLFQGIFSAQLVWAARKESRGDVQAALLWYTRASAGFLQRDVLLRRAALLLDAGDSSQAELLTQRYIDAMTDDWRGWKALGEIARIRKKPDQSLAAFSKAFERGRFTDLSAVRSFVEAERESKNIEVLSAKKAAIDALLDEFSVLIEGNVSRIAESDNVNDFIAVCNDFAALYPDEAPRYTVAAAKADRLSRMYRKHP